MLILSTEVFSLDNQTRQTMVLENVKTASKKSFLFVLCLFAWIGMEAAVLHSPLLGPPDTTDIAFNDANNDDKLLRGVDGPYLFRKRNKIRAIKVIANAEEYEVREELIADCSEKANFLCEVENKDRDAFSFQLRDKIKSPKSYYKQPSKLFAISDIEGNFDAFYSILIGAGIMDKQYNWIYGEGHLVLVGDFVDRGTNVTQCLWLIYKLEQEAEKHGGMVHFVLGNHEVMNFQGITEYVDKKYIALAHRLSSKEDKKEAYDYLMSNRRELVTWMKSKNVIERIGETIFVHGGISPKLPTANLSIDGINMLMRKYMTHSHFMDKDEESLVDFLLSPLGPLWYRGLLGRYKQMYAKTTPKELTATLKYFHAKQVVIGHTVVADVSSDYEGKVYRTDIGFPDMKFTGRSQGLLIENGHFFRVNDLGEKVLLN